MEELKKLLYKPLVETGDGRLVSIWAGGIVGVRLEYKEGEITYTPGGGKGIWVSESLEAAISQAQDNGRTTKAETSGTFVVYEATPLGEKCGEIKTESGFRSTFSSDLRYPAILLGKEVWREPGRLLRPEPKFKAGDSVIVKRTGGGSSVHRFGTGFTISKVVWGVEDMGSDHPHYHYYEEGDTIPCDEDILELAPPEPEWVDVTSQCEVRVKSSTGKGCHLELSHQGQWLIEAGIYKSRIVAQVRNYKVEAAGESATPGTFHLFRVLKRSSQPRWGMR